MSLDDPEVVCAEYASEDGLVARASVYQGVAGPDARDVVFDAVAQARPGEVLEVGCGWGELAARIRDEVTESVVAVDISPRMVELARRRASTRGRETSARFRSSTRRSTA
jgi:2-polyprenyl-3-methyl-5-hydroxy-6-metoxy-1,4-benzoquinol methylase